MSTIEAIFEGGVFRPVVPVVLPEKSRVQLHIVDERPVANIDDMEGIYEILDRRYDTGIRDLAARHDEHEP